MSASASRATANAAWVADVREHTRQLYSAIGELAISYQNEKVRIDGPGVEAMLRALAAARHLELDAWELDEETGAPKGEKPEGRVTQ